MNRAARASEPRASSATSAPTSTNDAPAARYRSAASGVERVHADGFTHSAHGLEGTQHGGHDVGVRLLTPHAHRRRQVGRPDEHAVHPVHRGDLGCGIHPRGRLDLDEQRHVVGGVLEVGVDSVPSPGSSEGIADPARSEGRVSHRGDRRGRLLGRGDHRHQEVLRADVEHLLDRDDVADRHAHDRCDRVCGHRLQLRQHGLEAVRGVLHVDERPVHARPGADLGDQRRPGAYPDPHEGAGCCPEDIAERGG